MPCSDPQAEEHRKEEKERLNKVTRVACELAGLVKLLTAFTLTKETHDWIKEHQAFDQARER